MLLHCYCEPEGHGNHFVIAMERSNLIFLRDCFVTAFLAMTRSGCAACSERSEESYSLRNDILFNAFVLDSFLDSFSHQADELFHRIDNP